MTGYKINIKYYIYIERESTNSTILILEIQYYFWWLEKMKYLNVSLRKHILDLYAENYTMQMKNIREDLNNVKAHHVFELKGSL